MQKDYKNQTFDPSAFVKLKEVEAGYFWFKIRRWWIFDKISKYCPPPAELLEIGCGTGNVSSFLSEKGYSVTGCDFYNDAFDMAWPGFKTVQGSADNLPFEDCSFDIAGMFDVIEHIDDDIDSVKEAVRVTKKGGLIAVTVPARKELWSRVDEISYHKRRYAKEDICALFAKCGIKTMSVDYMFMSLYLPMKMTRSAKIDEDGIFNINPVINTLSKMIFNAERIASKKLALPIGTSLIAIGRV